MITPIFRYFSLKLRNPKYKKCWYSTLKLYNFATFTYDWSRRGVSIEERFVPSQSTGHIIIANFLWWFNESKTPSRHRFQSVAITRIWKDFFFYYSNGILLPKLFWPTVRKNCSSDREKLFSLEFATFLRSLEQFIQTVKGQNNFW